MTKISRVRLLIGGIVMLLTLIAMPLGAAVISSAATSSVADVSSDNSSVVTQVDIPELGISLSVPSELKDLKYTVDSTTVPGTPFVYLSTTALEALDDATMRCDSSQGAIGAMWRIAQNPATIPDMHYNAAKFVGGSYLVFEAPQGACSAKPAVLQQQMRLVGLLKDALSGAQASTAGSAQ